MEPSCGENLLSHELLEVKMEPKSFGEYGCQFSQPPLCQRELSPPPADADLLDIKLEDLCNNYMDNDNRFTYVEPQPCDDAGYDTCTTFSPDSDFDRDWIDSPSSVESFLSSCSEIVDSYQRNEQHKRQLALELEQLTRLPTTTVPMSPTPPTPPTPPTILTPSMETTPTVPLRIRIPHIPVTEPITPPPSPPCSPPQLTMAPIRQSRKGLTQPQHIQLKHTPIRKHSTPSNPPTPQQLQPQTSQPRPQSPIDVLQQAIQQNMLFSDKSQPQMPSLQIYPSIQQQNR